MKTHFLKFLVIIWAFCILVSAGAYADSSDTETVLLSQEDPPGDELGPGTFTYPLHQHFEPYEGLFDLTQFEIVETEQTYRLELTFACIEDPWRSKYGFSHPLIQIYIDNAPGGSTELFKPGANVKLDPEVKWDVMLHITGWWVRLFRPADREKLNSMEIYWNDAKNPFDLESASVKLKDNVIQIELPTDVIGPLKTSRLSVLIGSFYAFGYDHYRDIAVKSSDWAFGGAVNPDLTPRVLDLLLPEGVSQAEVLQQEEGAGEFPTIPYIDVGDKVRPGLGERELIWLTALMVVLLLAGIVFRKSKKNPVSS